MSNETRSTSIAPRTAWQRFWAWLKAFGEAVDTSYDEVQDRRILALEREVARLRRKVAAVEADAPESANSAARS